MREMELCLFSDSRFYTVLDMLVNFVDYGYEVLSNNK